MSVQIDALLAEIEIEKRQPKPNKARMKFLVKQIEKIADDQRVYDYECARFCPTNVRSWEDIENDDL